MSEQKIECWAAVADDKDFRFCDVYKTEPRRYFYTWERAQILVHCSEPLAKMLCRGMRKGTKKPITIRITDGHEGVV